MICFNNVSKRYSKGHDALLGVSFELQTSELAFLTGHSGAGKSTLLKLIMLMERPSRGQIFIGKKNLGRVRNHQIPYFRRQIGVVFQNHSLLYDRTVFDNVALPLQVSGVGPREQGRRVRAALEKVGLLHKENDNPVALSGGEQQRVGIARAVVNKPKILLADEPTGNLDPVLSAEVMQLFKDFSSVGVTVLIASHDISLIKQLHRRVLTLSSGRLVNDDIAFVEDGYAES